MNNTDEIQVAEEVLRRSGFLANRVVIVNAIENELATIYSELDTGLPSTHLEYPVSYASTIQTVVDLISNREIYRTLYLLQEKSERSFLRRLAHNEDLYVKVLRGKKADYSQYWYFNFPVGKNESGVSWNGHFSFTLRIGVRDTYPYEIKIRDQLGEASFKSFLSHIRGE
jgi:hypothetical protein